MKAFKDNANRTWVVCINVHAIRKVRALLGIDLYGLVDDQFQGIAELIGDPIRFVDVLYCLCKDEADALEVTDEDFGRAMAGDCIRVAIDAFLEELTDFFPDPRVRQGMKRMLDISRKITDQMIDHSIKTMDEIDLDSILTRLKSSSGNLPDRSGSIPENSRSGN